MSPVNIQTLPTMHAPMKTYYKKAKLFMLLAFTMLGSLFANAEVLNKNVTINLDFCQERTHIVMTLPNLPATADISSIKWYKIDQTGLTTLEHSGSATYTSKFTRRYYASYLDNADGITYKTPVAITGQELVVNGGFEDGNVNFITNYTYKEDVPNDPSYQKELHPAGTYAIGENANNYHHIFHGLARGGSGNFMIVNGSSKGNLATIWTQNITSIEPGVTYYFSAQAISLSTYHIVGELSFSINGTNIGTTKVLKPATSEDENSEWLDENRFYGYWTAPVGVTQATLSIVNLNKNNNGNDFGIDDISFGTFSAPPVILDEVVGIQTTCEGEPISLSANTSGGCEAQFSYEWINHTNPDNPVLTSTSTSLDIAYPTINEHGGKWILAIKDAYSTDTLHFYLDLLESPGISFSTSCITKDPVTGIENNDGSLYIDETGIASYRVLDSSGNVLDNSGNTIGSGSDSSIGWYSSNLQYQGLSSGNYTIEAKYDDPNNACESSSIATLSSETLYLLPPKTICQKLTNTPIYITVTPSLCCFEWSASNLTFPDGSTDNYTYIMSGTLFENSLAEGRNTYTAGNEVSFKQVGVFRLDAVNNALKIIDDGSKTLSYSIYKYPFNPSRPANNYVTTVVYDTSLYTLAEQEIAGLHVGETYVIVANAPSTTPADYNGLTYSDAGSMLSASFPNVSWFANATSTTPVATGPSVSTSTLNIDTTVPNIVTGYVSCCESGCEREQVTFTIFPTPVVEFEQTNICAQAENAVPPAKDIHGNLIDTDLFPIEYKWTVLSAVGILERPLPTGIFREVESIKIELEDGYACGEEVFEIIARAGGVEGCLSEPTEVHFKVVNLEKIDKPYTLEACVIPIIEATWNDVGEPNTDIKEPRPDYVLLKAGNTSIDFSLDRLAACAQDVNEHLFWSIYDDNSNIITDVNGNPLDNIQGQPSSYTSGNIKLDGDASDIINYQIVYTLNIDCSGSVVQYVRNININPRPEVTKGNL